MTDSSIWSVDRLAASNLLASLGLGPEQLELVAEHFARNRVASYEWIVDRVRTNIVHRLEDVAQDQRGHRRDNWSEGFQFAEQTVMSMSPTDLLGIISPRSRSKGQVLRTMVRQARQKYANR